MNGLPPWLSSSLYLQSFSRTDDPQTVTLTLNPVVNYGGKGSPPRQCAARVLGVVKGARNAQAEARVFIGNNFMP